MRKEKLTKFKQSTLDISSTECYDIIIASSLRCFKTAWFARAAKKAKITDEELYEAILEVAKGQADDLGSGVFKKRLNKNMHRSIIIAKGGEYWVYTYLYAKNRKANISDDDVVRLRGYAKLYTHKTAKEIAGDILTGELLEIHYEKTI